MLHKIFKEEGQVIPGLVLYNRIKEILDNDPILSSVRDLDCIKNNFNSPITAPLTVLIEWRSLLGIKITNPERVIRLNSNDKAPISTKKLYKIDSIASPRRNLSNTRDDGLVAIGGISVIDPKESASIYSRPHLRIALEDMEFHFMVIANLCEQQDRQLIEDIVIKSYRERFNELIDPPADVIKKFFPETFTKEAKETFLRTYKHNNVNGILDYILETKTNNEALERLKSKLYEKRTQ